MTTTGLKRLLDACFMAKQVVERLPALPDGMRPRHVHVLESIHEIQAQQTYCRVSDISARFHITTPSVTKLIQELETLGMVKKETSPTDRRVTLLSLTSTGEVCVQKHVFNFHNNWIQNLDCIDDKQADELFHIIELLQTSMPGEEGLKDVRK